MIANRTPERAQALAGELGGAGRRVEAIALCGDALRRAGGEARLIVNSTSIGMMHGPAEGSSPLEAGYIPRGAVVYDMVYNPAETPLLSQARAAGANPVGGLSMLIYQGAAAFELWTGKDAPIEVMFDAAETALAGH